MYCSKPDEAGHKTFCLIHGEYVTNLYIPLILSWNTNGSRYLEQGIQAAYRSGHDYLQNKVLRNAVIN